jgi:hypothetical protein
MITGLSPTRVRKCTQWYTFLSFTPFLKQSLHMYCIQDTFNSSAQCGRKNWDIEIIERISYRNEVKTKMVR